MDAKWLLTVAGLVIVMFLVVAGTIAKDINYTAVALAFVSLLGLLHGTRPPDKGDK